MTSAARDRKQARARSTRVAPAVLAAAGLGLLAAACGGSPRSHVTQTGSTAHLPSAGDRQKLGFALEVARCMRSHGFPAYPDPASSSASSQGSGTRFEGTGIDTKSAPFQATETTCEKRSRRALGLP